MASFMVFGASKSPAAAVLIKSHVGTIGALIIRKGPWCILYYNYSKDPSPPPKKKK